MEDLYAALDALILPTRTRIIRDVTKQAEWHTIPSVWDQLSQSTAWSGGNGGGGAYSSRPTISAGAIDIISAATAAAAEAAKEHTGSTRRTTPDNMRAVAASLGTSRDQDQITWWTEALIRWTSDARTILGLNPPLPRNLRKTVCPQCGADVILTDNNAGEKVRTSALTIIWTCPPGDAHKTDTDWTVRAIQCQSCNATWFRGSDLDHLIANVLNDNTTRETMTDS